jgi:hypothetical protein
MSVLNIIATDLARAKQLNAQGDISGAWALLGDKGDAYAFLAGKIVANNTAGMPLLAQVFYNLVRIQWDNTAGAGLWGGAIFQAVGKQHLANYIDLLETNLVSGGYTLPTTLQIEASYKSALADFSLPPITAIDSLFSVLDTAAGSAIDRSWVDIMNVANALMGGPSWQADRIVYNSDVFTGTVTPLEAAITLGRTTVNAMDAIGAGAAVQLTPFAPAYWLMKLIDGTIDFTIVDFVNQYLRDRPRFFANIQHPYH